MNKNREKTNKKLEEKHPIYDNIAVSERTLSILIVFGIIAAALAMTCGYFMGNKDDESIPVYSRYADAEICLECQNQPKVY